MQYLSREFYWTLKIGVTGFEKTSQTLTNRIDTAFVGTWVNFVDKYGQNILGIFRA